MQGAAKALPLYVWLVALPQLASRVCHAHTETQKMTQHILTRVTGDFPHQVTACPCGPHHHLLFVHQWDSFERNPTRKRHAILLKDMTIRPNPYFITL